MVQTIITRDVTLVVSTVHHGPRGGAIFTGSDARQQWYRVVADYTTLLHRPEPGDVLHITGRVGQHPEYGAQLHADRVEPVLPPPEQLVTFLVRHRAFRGTGVGVRKARDLYQRFGKRLLDLLNTEDTEPLAAVLTPETAAKLVAAWKHTFREWSLISFLGRHQLGVRLARRLLRYWPEDPIAKLRENPYRLLLFENWKTVDRIAQALGLAMDDPRRLVGAVEAAVYDRLDEHRDTLIDEETLRRGVRQHLGFPKKVSEAIDQALSDGCLVGDAVSGYQPAGCAQMEGVIARRFLGLARGHAPSQQSLLGPTVAATGLDQVLNDFERRERKTLDEDQRAAVHHALMKPFSVLVGWPGTGKTLVIKAVHYAMEQLLRPGHVYQMAVAGRAVQRLREVTEGCPGWTIARFLGQRQGQKIVMGAGDLIVIDESSMVDLGLMYRLVRCVDPNVRWLLVGDPDQLPPVSFGLVFHIAARSSAVPVRRLRRIYRQSDASGIPEYAQLFREGTVPSLPSFGGKASGVSFVDATRDRIVEVVEEIHTALGEDDDTQTLCVRKSGPGSVEAINSHFQILRTGSRPRLPDWPLAEGDPIIYTENDYELELYNGSIGVIERLVDQEGLDINGAPVRAICRFDDRRLPFTDNELMKADLCYGLTTHKAQGSQWKRVIICVVESQILDRTLLYTALTRGQDQVVFVGERAAFTRAIKSPPSALQRRVGFSLDPMSGPTGKPREEGATSVP